MASPDISVVIPVFNAAEYVAGAVSSALMQPEVREVILVEDGSADSSADVCRALADQHAVVRLLQHPDRGNHGASASRNLGIRSATSPYLALLDADDYYLEDRFSVASEIMRRRSECDGVFEAVGTRFQSDAYRRRLESQGLRMPDLSTVEQPHEGFDLFLAFAAHRTNHFLLNGLTVRTSVFDRVGLFDVNLKLSQDSEMAFRLAAKCHLVPGRLDTPVAVRRIHAGNRYWVRRSSKEWMEAFRPYAASSVAWAHENLPGRYYRLVRDHLLVTSYVGRLTGPTADAGPLGRVGLRFALAASALTAPTVFLRRRFWKTVIPREARSAIRKIVGD